MVFGVGGELGDDDVGAFAGGDEGPGGSVPLEIVLDKLDGGGLTARTGTWTSHNDVFDGAGDEGAVGDGGAAGGTSADEGVGVGFVDELGGGGVPCLVGLLDVVGG